MCLEVQHKASSSFCRISFSEYHLKIHDFACAQFNLYQYQSQDLHRVYHECESRRGSWLMIFSRVNHVVVKTLGVSGQASPLFGNIHPAGNESLWSWFGHLLPGFCEHRLVSNHDRRVNEGIALTAMTDAKRKGIGCQSVCS